MIKNNISFLDVFNDPIYWVTLYKVCILFLFMKIIYGFVKFKSVA